MVLEGQVPFSRTAAGQDGRISGVEKLLHLLLLIRSSVDVAVSVNEPRHCTHAPCVDSLHPGNAGAGRNRRDPAAPNDDRTLIDHVTVTNNDPRVGDDQILGRETSDATEAPGENK